MPTVDTTRNPVRGRVRRREATPAPSKLTTRARDTAEKTVSIVFELSANTMVTLAIFNDEGRLVDVPYEGWLWPGRHEIDCCLEGRSPGKYKCLLDTPTVRLVKYIDVRFQ